MEITIKISKPDFDLAIPAAKEPKGSVFAKLEDKINAGIEDIAIDKLGDVGVSAVNNEPEGRLAKTVISLASVEVFLREMRGLDLVLTESGFGIVSSNNTAPASKIRVDALDGELRVKRLFLMDELLEECFCPSFLTQTKRSGEWQYVERLLLPGYLIAVTAYPDELRDLLRAVPDFARVLAMGETFVPLRENERAWIEEFTKPGDRTIPMSQGYMRGDTLVATEGPLVGHEGLITRVNRHKSLAVLEFHIGGKRVTTRVGLGIVSEQEAEEGQHRRRL